MKKNKKIVLIVVACLLVVVLGTVGIIRYKQAKENQTMNAVAQKNPDLGETTKETKLYFKADTTSKVLYDVPKGTKFTILSTDSNYYMVTFKGTDNKGYMGYILKSETRRISNIEKTTQEIDIYFKPDMTSKLITTIPEGSRVSYLSRTKEYKDDNNNIYYMISYKDEDGTGYIGYALYEDLMTNETIEIEEEEEADLEPDTEEESDSEADSESELEPETTPEPETIPEPEPTPAPTPAPREEDISIDIVSNSSSGSTYYYPATIKGSYKNTLNHEGGYTIYKSWDNQTWYNGGDFNEIKTATTKTAYIKVCVANGQCATKSKTFKIAARGKIGGSSQSDNLKSISTGYIPQGFTTMGNSFVLAFSKKGNGSQYIYTCNASFSCSKKATKSNLGHANDLTYDGEALFMSELNTVFRINPSTWNTTSNTAFTKKASGIAYDAQVNKYYLAKGSSIHIYDGNKNFVKTFSKYKSNTPQGIGAYNGYVLVIDYKSGGAKDPKNDNINNAKNTIDVYRNDGVYMGSYIIHTSLEVESISYGNGKFYLFINSSNTGIIRTISLSNFPPIYQ